MLLPCVAPSPTYLCATSIIHVLVRFSTIFHFFFYIFFRSPSSPPLDREHQVMEAAVSRMDSRQTLVAAILPHCASSSYKIAEEAVVWSSKCLATMTAEELVGGKGGRKEVGFGEMVIAFSRGLRGKQQETRTSAAAGLTRRGFAKTSMERGKCCGYFGIHPQPNKK